MLCPLTLVSTGAVELEEKIITHMAIQFGMDPKSRGVLSSDICTANELAFIAARQFKFAYTVDPDPDPMKRRKGRGQRMKIVSKKVEEAEEIALDNTKFAK